MGQLISLIIPCYDVEKYLQVCFTSILHQSYENWEIIAVDDGSSDRTSYIIEENVLKDKRIKGYSISHRGISVARNIGIFHSTGKYVMFIDADDYIAPKCLENLMEAILSNKAVIAVCQLKYTDENGNILSQDKKVTCGHQVLLTKDIWENYMLTSMILGVSQCLIRRELLQNLQFPIGRTYESITFMPQVIDRSQRLVIIPYVGYFYRQRKNSITHTNSFKQEKDLIEGYSELYFSFKDKYPVVCAVIKQYTLNKANLILRQENSGAYLDNEAMKEYFSDLKNFTRLYNDR